MKVFSKNSSIYVVSKTGYAVNFIYKFNDGSWYMGHPVSNTASAADSNLAGGRFGVSVGCTDVRSYYNYLFLADSLKDYFTSDYLKYIRFVSDVDSLVIKDDLSPDPPDPPDPPNPPDPPPITPPDISEPPPMQPPEIKPPPPMNAPPIVAPPSMPGPAIPPSDSKYVPYDTSVLQRFLDYIRQAIGSSTNIGFLIFAIIFGIGLIPKIIRMFSRGK